MNADGPPIDPWHHPQARNYLFLALGALAVLLLTSWQRGLGICAFFPVLLGVLGVLTRWGAVPILVVLTIVLSHGELWYMVAEGHYFLPEFHVSDLILSAALLAFVGSHYRLQALTRHIIPPDPRFRLGAVGRVPRSLRRLLADYRPVRPAQQVSVLEVATFLVSVAYWPLMAWTVWTFLPTDVDRYNLAPHLWRMLILLWVLGVGWLVAAGLLRYVERLRMSRREAALLLQDGLWQETRGQQRLVARWLAWLSLPHYHRKDLP